MLGVQVQPWSMRYFATALVSLMLALAWLVAIPLVTPGTLGSPLTLVAVHLTVIGWMSLLMLGALHQFVPVIATRRLWNDALPAWTLGLVAGGLIGMLVGFLGLPTGPLQGMALAAPLLPIGGGAVVIGFTLAIVNLGLTLFAARPLSLSARYVASALGFSFLTVLLGLTFALAFSGSGLLPPALAPLIGAALPLHILAGVAGWLTLTAMGVALKLLSMFMLSPEERGALGELAWMAAAGGVAIGWTSGIVGLLVASAWLADLSLAGWCLLGAGVILYLIDMRRLYRSRRRRRLELNARLGAWALACLGVTSLLVLMAWAGQGRDPAWVIASVYVALFGWLGGLGLSQLYKIVPFLTWIERYGRRMGRERVPLVQDLVNEDRAMPYYVLYFAAVGVGTASLGLGLSLWFHLADAVTLVAVAGISRELWWIRHGHGAGAAAGPLVQVTGSGQGLSS